MVKTDVHTFLDKARVRAAIDAAEKTTSAPISVSVAPHVDGDVHEAALRALRRHGLVRASARNAVHFLIVPSRREFAVVGDANAHAAVPQDIWDAVAATVSKHFRNGNMTAGVIAGIQEIATHLAPQYPPAKLGTTQSE